jgi:hypothetical protein
MRPSEKAQGNNRGDAPVLRGMERRQYLDDMVDDYVSWREACAMVSAAYLHWNRAGREDQTLAFSEYVTALNCEEEAAAAYQHAAERVTASHVRAAR